MDKTLDFLNRRIIPIVLIVFIFIVIFVKYAEPVRDGDLWFHLAYAKYFLDHGTLISDHTVFTWSQTSNETIYCAWLSQLVLYFLITTFGLWSGFLLRYLALCLFVFVFFTLARKLKLLTHPITWFICLLGVLMSYSGMFIKPEIFSYILMTIVVGIWSYLRIHHSAEKHIWMVYSFPVIMLIWVNTHGMFIAGAFFLFFIGIGEGINQIFSLKTRLSRRFSIHFGISLVLSAITLCVNPYGWKYPAYLVNRNLTRDGFDQVINTAYGPIFGGAGHFFHYPDYLFCMLFFLVPLFVLYTRRKGLDFNLLLPNLFFCFVYAQALRMTYFWVPVACFSGLYLLAGTDNLFADKKNIQKKWLAGLGILLTAGSLFLGGRALMDAKVQPVKDRWLGFGISYQNPVEEAEFINTYISETRIGNDYNNGGYLLWKLWPGKKIFIDPRQFPFRSWIKEYYNAMSEPGYNREQFLKKHPAKVWCLGYTSRQMIRYMLNSPEWRPVFYGPSSIVFVDQSVHISKTAPQFSNQLFHPKNIRKARYWLHFAVAIGDWETAYKIADKILIKFPYKQYEDITKGAIPFVRGTQLFHAGSYKESAANLQLALDHKYTTSSSALNMAYTYLSIDAWKQNSISKSYDYVNAAVRTRIENPFTLFNAGIINWYYETRIKSRTSERFQFEPDWQRYLNRFLALYGNEVPDQAVELATQVLKGKYQKQRRPPLLMPPR